MERTEIMAWQHMRANHDVNGNPRRCYVIYGGEGNVIDVIDEGYAGLPGWLRDYPQLPTINVTVAEYRDLLRTGATRVES